ncbi:MAG: hypothetical protein HY855_02830 [Burkholderiales bacterium]|nr:hypothetical protein [Burkholderiales bacterium]
MGPESIYEALIECCRAIGGSKAAAALLWPAKAARDVEDARRYLAACLNPDRSEKLSLDEVLLIMRTARDHGCHIGMNYLATTLGYAEPVPIDTKDELAELLRASIEANRETQRRQERIERLLEQQQPRPRAVA